MEKWIAIAVMAFFAMIAVVNVYSEYAATLQMTACASASNKEWVRTSEYPIVMECRVK